MWIQRRLLISLIGLVVIAGCGQIPLISPNRKNFPPWEKLPAGNGIEYLEKFTHDPGIDPTYLAKIKYSDTEALQRVIDTFGLVTLIEPIEVSSFAKLKANVCPKWFPLKQTTEIYVYPFRPNDEYVANLWVDRNNKVMILERSWW